MTCLGLNGVCVCGGVRDGGKQEKCLITEHSTPTLHLCTLTTMKKTAYKNVNVKRTDDGECFLCNTFTLQTRRSSFACLPFDKTHYSFVTANG